MVLFAVQQLATCLSYVVLFAHQQLYLLSYWHGVHGNSCIFKLRGTLCRVTATFTLLSIVGMATVPNLRIAGTLKV